MPDHDTASMDTAQALLRECRRALNIAPRFPFHGRGGNTDSYALAARLDRYLADRGHAYDALTPPVQDAYDALTDYLLDLSGDGDSDDPENSPDWEELDPEADAARCALSDLLESLATRPRD